MAALSDSNKRIDALQSSVEELLKEVSKKLNKIELSERIKEFDLMKHTMKKSDNSVPDKSLQNKEIELLRTEMNQRFSSFQPAIDSDQIRQIIREEIASRMDSLINMKLDSFTKKININSSTPTGNSPLNFNLLKLEVDKMKILIGNLTKELSDLNLSLADSENHSKKLDSKENNEKTPKISTTSDDKNPNLDKTIATLIQQLSSFNSRIASLEMKQGIVTYGGKKK